MKAELRHRIVRIVLTAVIFGLFGAMFVPFFAPLLMAALFGFALEGVVSKYGIKRSKRKYPTAIILLLFFFLISLPVGLVGYRLVSLASTLAQTNLQDTSLYHSLESLIMSIESFANRALAVVDASPPEGGVMNFLPGVGAWILSYTAMLATQTPQILIQLFIFSAALYLFLTEATYIRMVVSSFKILKEGELDQIIRVVQRSSYITLVVSAAVGSVQALIVAIGGVFFGFREFFLLFVITFFTSFIPVIGAAPVALFLALLSLIQGNIFSAVGLTVVAVVAGSVDNIIKPLIVASSSEESINPIISLLAIIGGVIVYGLPGLLLGPILTELTLKIVPILFHEEEKEEAENSASLVP
jgi:predicted PurR-regulated permease PerM